MLLTGFLSGSHLVSFLIQGSPTCLGFALPTVDWAILHLIALHIMDVAPLLVLWTVDHFL